MLHRLVREVWKTQRKLKADFAENLADYMKSIQAKFLHLRELDRAAVQALRWLEQINKPELQAALLGVSAFPDYYRGKYRDALTLVDRAMALVEHRSESPTVTDIHTYKGILTHNLGDAKAAKPYYENALKMRQKLYPDQDHPDVARSLSNMGSVLESLGNAKAAKPYDENALKMRQRLYPDQDHLDVAQSLNNLGFLYKNFKQYIKAKEYLNKALNIWKSLGIEVSQQHYISVALKQINKKIKMQEKRGSKKGRFCKDMK